MSSGPSWDTDRASKQRTAKCRLDFQCEKNGCEVAKLIAAPNIIWPPKKDSDATSMSEYETSRVPDYAPGIINIWYPLMSHHFRIISHPTHSTHPTGPTCYTGLTFQSQSFLIESHFILRMAQVLALDVTKGSFLWSSFFCTHHLGIVFMYKKTYHLW